MELFNASALFSDAALQDMLGVIDNPEELQKRAVAIKKTLLQAYNFKVYNLPEDFATTSYVIAANHLTDSDAPLIMSFYYEHMHRLVHGYPRLFVFAKENCFNGVSIPKALLPVLEMEKVVAVDRASLSGSMAAMREAGRWFREEEGAKHYLIFSQGTIYDINNDAVEDIESGAFWLAKSLGIPVLPAFIEQAVEGAENRLVFGEPIVVAKNCRNFEGHKKDWLESVIKAQDSLKELTGTPARPVKLDRAHQIRKRFKPAE